MIKLVSERKEERVAEAAKAYAKSSKLRKEDLKQKLLSAVDALTMDDEGFKLLLQQVPTLVELGIFKGTVWEQPEKLVPTLVGGTLQAGFPTDVMEILSEMRMLNLANSNKSPEKVKRQSLDFLREVVVKNMNLLYAESTEERRNASNGSGKKLERLFLFIIEHIPTDDIKQSFADEIEVLVAQRRIVTERLVQMLQLVEDRIPLNTGQPADDRLQFYLTALKYPSDGTQKHTDQESYRRFLKDADSETLREEALDHGDKMAATGLVSHSHVILLQHLNRHEPDFVPACLHLKDYGFVEWENHRDFILQLIEKGITLDYPQSVYGLHRLLSRSLLSRSPVKNALTRMFNLALHGNVKSLLRHKRSHFHDNEMTLLIAGVICVLGSPLGIGQGNNPTCQSARGISMWSQHSPAKLLQMITLCAVQNTLDITYEGELLESRTAGEGLTKNFDFNLDPVSIVLVPHLDKLYNAMMTKAALKHPFVDPHSSVNPEFYGSFIQNGFEAVYDNVFHAIKDYNRAVAIFYHSFHPQYNGNNPVVYPVPLGIFITTAQGEMLGFHAISLLRVARDPQGKWRVYFLNPNDEGRQNWGQGISPSVHGNGEEAGESSLPFYQMVSRVYAFHYNELMIKNSLLEIPDEEIEGVEKLARESWGRKYNWI